MSKQFRRFGFKLREKLFKRTVTFWYIHCFINSLWREKKIKFLKPLNDFFAACWLADTWRDIPNKFKWFSK